MSDRKLQFTANYRRNYVAFMAVALFFFIIAGEIVLATGIPLLMRNENLMSEEAARNELLATFDQARKRCDSITGLNASKQEDEIILLEKQLISNALNRFARYMKNEGDKLTPEEVKQINRAVTTLFKAADRLANGESFSKEHRLDTAKYVNDLLKQTNGTK